MKASGYIPNPRDPMSIHIYCYYCSKPVRKGLPIEGHRQCLREGKLFVVVETENYEGDS